MRVATPMHLSLSSSLTVEVVARVAADVVRQEAPAYEVVGVKVNDRDSDYTEVIVRHLDCPFAPCVATIGIFRGTGEAMLRKVLAESLRRQEAHPRGKL